MHDADDEAGEDTNSISHSALIIGHGVKVFKIKKFIGLVYGLAYLYGPHKLLLLSAISRTLPTYKKKVGEGERGRGGGKGQTKDFPI